MSHGKAKCIISYFTKMKRYDSRKKAKLREEEGGLRSRDELPPKVIILYNTKNSLHFRNQQASCSKPKMIDLPPNSIVKRDSTVLFWN